MAARGVLVDNAALGGAAALSLASLSMRLLGARRDDGTTEN